MLVAQRSATLVAMALCALLEHTGWAANEPPAPISVAVDGGVYEQFAEYRRMLGAALTEQLGERISSWVAERHCGAELAVMHALPFASKSEVHFLFWIMFLYLQEAPRPGWSSWSFRTTDRVLGLLCWLLLPHEVLSQIRHFCLNSQAQQSMPMNDLDVNSTAAGLNSFYPG